MSSTDKQKLGVDRVLLCLYNIGNAFTTTYIYYNFQPQNPQGCLWFFCVRVSWLKWAGYGAVFSPFFRG